MIYSAARRMRERLPRILIVDDQPDMLRTMERLLRGDVEVTVAASGFQAWERIERGERFDVVLCDIMMPGMTGLDLFDRVLAHDPAAAATFVFTTGGIAADQEQRLAATGARCLGKPCDLALLRRLIAGEEPVLPPASGSRG